MAYHCLFSLFLYDFFKLQFLIQFVNNKICWWLDPNRGSLMSEATALPIAPQPLLCFCPQKWYKSKGLDRTKERERKKVKEAQKLTQEWETYLLLMMIISSSSPSNSKRFRNRCLLKVDFQHPINYVSVTSKMEKVILENKNTVRNVCLTYSKPGCNNLKLLKAWLRAAWSDLAKFWHFVKFYDLIIFTVWTYFVNFWIANGIFLF